jgi:hypothetical protein
MWIYVLCVLATLLLLTTFAAAAAAGVNPTALGLDGSKFTSSHSLLSLHMWLVIRRLAEEGTPPPKDAKVSIESQCGMYMYSYMRINFAFYLAIANHLHVYHQCVASHIYRATHGTATHGHVLSLLLLVAVA